MKSPSLQAHLEEGTTTLAWCWRITRADGVTFGFTNHERTLGFDGTEFEPDSGPTASEERSRSDLSVDAQDAEGVLTSDRITETDIFDGRWDNAEVWRLNWTDTSQRVLMRRGAISQIRRGRLPEPAGRGLHHILEDLVEATGWTPSHVEEIAEPSCPPGATFCGGSSCAAPSLPGTRRPISTPITNVPNGQRSMTRQTSGWAQLKPTVKRRPASIDCPPRYRPHHDIAYDPSFAASLASHAPVLSAAEPLPAPSFAPSAGLVLSEGWPLRRAGRPSGFSG